MCSLLVSLFMALALLPLCTAQNSSGHNVDVHVGVILDFDSLVGRVGNACLSMARSDFYLAHGNYKTRLVLHPIDSNGSVVGAAAAALDLLQDVKVDVIVGPQKSSQASFVMDLGDRAHVPIISFSATSPSLIRRTPYFVQTAQSDANQVQAVASIIEVLKWSQVVIIYEDTEFGNGIIPYLSNALEDVGARVSYKSVLMRTDNDEIISNELDKMMAMETRVFVVHMSQFLGTKLFLNARELGMMTEGYAWIVTSGLTDLFSLVDSDVVEAMQGFLGVRPVISKSRELQAMAARWIKASLQDNQDMKLAGTSAFCLWAYDTLWALAMAADEVGNNGSNVTENEANINSTKPFTLGVSVTGPKLLQTLLKTKFPGLSGEFNLVNGQLEQTAYQIVNFVGSMERPVGTWIPSDGISGKRNGTARTLSASNYKIRTIIWPGDSANAPRGLEFLAGRKMLRIGVPVRPGNDEFLKVEIDPQTNKTKATGFDTDVFAAVMAELPYDLPYEFVPYPFLNPDGSVAGSYDDLLYDVFLQKHFDGALGEITATSNRSMYVDFTVSYSQGGVACIVPTKLENINDMFTFLEPLTTELWLATAVFYVSTAIVIWFLSKRIVQRSKSSPGQHAGMMCYFPFFPGEGIEANLVCLILVTWALVASLLSSTYTANLSTRLTVAKLQTTFTPSNGGYVGCFGDSFVVGYLKNLGFYESRIRIYNSIHESRKALSLGSKNGGISAYCDILPRINHILSQSCGQYKIVGAVHPADGYAFAFPKGFAAVSDISRGIIRLTESGAIQKMEQVIYNAECPDDSSSLNRVSLRSFLVLFAISGFATVICLVVSLLVPLHNNQSLLKRMSDLIAYIFSKILALQKYFKRNEPSSLLKTTSSRDQKQVAETGSSS